MSLVQCFSTVLLVMLIVLCGVLILRTWCLAPWGGSRVEEIRRLRQEGLAVHQEGES